MRTENDLRAAFRALERNAPDADRVLSGVLRQGRRGAVAPRRWMAGLAAGAVVAAAGAAAAVMALGSGAVPAHQGTAPRAAAAGTPAAAPLRTAILAAFDKADGLISYTRQVVVVSNRTTRAEVWAYPAQPRPGQQVRARSLMSGSQDTSFAYVEPAASGRISGEVTDVEYWNRTWSQGTQVYVKQGSTDPAATLRAEIARGGYSVAGRTTLDGQAVIEIVAHDWGGPGSTSYLWVNAHTHLPVKSVFEYTPGKPGAYGTGTITDYYAYLPPTGANLGNLQAVIPGGFTRTATQELPPSSGKG